MPASPYTSLSQVPAEYQPLLRSAAARLAEEFAGVFGVETIERYIASSLDELLAHARVREFIPLFTERFARDRLWSLAKIEKRMAAELPLVLFLCVENAGRSQMAAGWLAHLAGGRAGGSR